MTFGARHSFVSGAFPNNFSSGFIERVHAPGMFGHIGRRINVAEKPVAKYGVGIAADSCGDENAVAPNDGAGMSQPRDLCLPADVDRLDAVEARWARTFPDAGCAGPAERRPVLRAGGNGDAKNYSQALHCVTDRFITMGWPSPRRNVSEITLPFSTLNVIVAAGISAGRNVTLSTASSVSLKPPFPPVSLPSTTSNFTSEPSEA